MACSLPNELRVTAYGAEQWSGRVAGCRISSRGELELELEVSIDGCRVLKLPPGAP